MLKWILIIVGVLVVLVVGTCYLGYRQITSEGGTAAVAIATTPERAWSWLSNPDSLAAIADTSVTITTNVTGDTLAVGDTLTVYSPGGEVRPDSGAMIWVVTQISPNRVRTLASTIDDSGTILLKRVDSVVAMGDSVRVSATYLAPGLFDEASDSGSNRLEGMFLTGAAKMVVGAMRHVTQTDLDRLKVALEGPQ